MNQNAWWNSGKNENYFVFTVIGDVHPRVKCLICETGHSTASRAEAKEWDEFIANKEEDSYLYLYPYVYFNFTVPVIWNQWWVSGIRTDTYTARTDNWTSIANVPFCLTHIQVSLYESLWHAITLYLKFKSSRRITVLGAGKA